jgi:putative DNA primase/helicase
MSSRRQQALEKAEYLARTSGGEVEDYLEEAFRDGNGSWKHYSKGERRGGKVVRDYEYFDKDGEPYLRVQRTEDKQFPQSWWDAKQWKWGKPKGPKIPYMLPQLIEASPETPIFICEGEKDVESVVDHLDLVATCASEGAGKWTPDLNPWFTGKQAVYILEDNDDPGRQHAQQVARNLSGIVNEVHIVTLPGLGDHGDVSDWIEAGGTKDELLELCAGAPIFIIRPSIQVKAGDLSAVADEGEKALLAAGIPLYQRSGNLVRPIVEKVNAARGRRTSVAQFKQIETVYLRDVLGRVADWTKSLKKGPQKIDPPHDVAATILARTGEWKFPVISGVITTPTMRPDGTILSEPGYDTATQLLLLDPPPMLPIPDTPTREDALAALARLEDLLTEFEFVDDVARAVALSAMITPVVRGAFSVTPMHVAQAPVAASGKSFLFDVVASIAIGQPMPVMSTGGTEEETEKRLGSSLLTGQPLISIDNVNGELAGDALCQIIERPMVDIRILGKSEKVRIEARGTSIFATGNNIVLVGDLCRRALIAKLDPKMERPELREFKGNPVMAVCAYRGAFIAAALTICRAYFVAGRPNRARLASFEGWSDTVRSALIWLGKADPVQSMEDAREDDPELGALRNMLSAWSETIGIGWNYRLTLKEVIELAGEMKTETGANGAPSVTHLHQQLFEAVHAVARTRHGQLDVSCFGQWARGRKGRFVGPLRLSSKPNAKGGSAWWVEDLVGTQQPGSKDAM